MPILNNLDYVKELGYIKEFRYNSLITLIYNIINAKGNAILCW